MSYTHNFFVQYSIQVSTNGLLSFTSSFMGELMVAFPFSGSALIAPLWTNFTFATSGTIYYRVTEDTATLALVADMITDMNPDLADYEPSLAIVVTWFEATMVTFTNLPHVS